MNSKLFVLGLAPLVALAGCESAGNNSTAADNVAAADNAMMAPDDNGAAPANDQMSAESMPAQRFADTAGASDAFEIAAGKLAQEKGESKAVKDFGAMMVAQHTDSTAKLKAAGAKSDPKVVPNPALNAEQEANLTALRGASGEAFDTLYKTQQIAAHQQALALMQAYAANGDAPAIKSFAQETAPVVETHLDKVRDL
jgi:putative membrane protein